MGFQRWKPEEVPGSLGIVVEKEQHESDQSGVWGTVAWRSGRVRPRLSVEGELNYIEPWMLREALWENAPAASGNLSMTPTSSRTPSMAPTLLISHDE